MVLGKRFNKVTGDSAENIACEYLKKLHYKIIEKNYKHKIGEIDIIAKDGDILVLVEVKFKTTDYFGLPREMVTPYKQQKIRRIAMGYIKQHRLFDTPCRFDVVEILNGEVTHLKDCF